MKSEAKGTFAGRVDRFNFNDPAKSFKIFWVQAAEGKKSGYAKGKEVSGRRIKVGDQIVLIGEWSVDPQYPRYGEQFFFTDYEIRK